MKLYNHVPSNYYTIIFQIYFPICGSFYQRNWKIPLIEKTTNQFDDHRLSIIIKKNEKTNKT